MKKAYAIVLAGGSGTRFGGDVPKQYRLLLHQPVLCYSLHAFEKSSVEGIVIVTAEGMQEYAQREIVEKYHIDKVMAIVAGGAERYLSVRKGLECLPEDGIVMVHDGARPFVSTELIKRMLRTAEEYPACIPGVPVNDTIKVVREGMAIKTPLRKELYAVQTPQAFEISLLRKAYEKLGTRQEEIQITDDAMLVEQMLDIKACVVEGETCNLKITTPEDFLVAEIFAEKSKKMLDK